MDLKPDQTRWRLAVEKVLRGAGLRLLVPDQHWGKVLRFVNETDMRGRLQLHHVRAKFLGAEPVEPEPNTLAGKLFAVDPTHPCAAEAVDVITSAGDHVCVDTPDVFARFRRAVTDAGLYKDSDRLAVKDDRRPVKQSDYLYQGDVAAKINALTLELATAEEAYQKARRAADDIAAAAPAVARPRGGVQGDLRAVPAVEPDRHRDRRRARRPAARTVRAAAGRQPRHRGAQRARRRMLVADPETDDAPRRHPDPPRRPRRAAHPAAGAAGAAVAGVRVGAADRAAAPLRRRRCRWRWSCSTPNRTATRCSPRSRRNANSCARAGAAPTTNWPASSTRSTPSFPDAIPNDSDDFDERVHDYVALCRHIDERELPEAYERMMRLVTEQAPDAILTLHRVAEQETRRISEQIDRVNTGLGSVEFNRGTRLTLRATPRQPDRGRRAHRDRAVHLAAHRRGRAGRQAGDPRPVRRHPAAAQPAGVHRAGGQGVDARRAGRAQPVHVRLRGVGRQHRGADPHAQQCRATTPAASRRS